MYTVLRFRPYTGPHIKWRRAQDDEFDSAAVGLSVRDPNFMPPHLLLSMSLPNNGPDFGRSGFRPVRFCFPPKVAAGSSLALDTVESRHVTSAHYNCSIKSTGSAVAAGH